jgi:hypothetical protein
MCRPHNKGSFNLNIRDYKYKETPEVLQLETTLICQAKCHFCPQKKATRSPKIMEWSTIEKVIEETRGLGIIYRPFLLNEPFADPRMPKIVSLIKEDKTAKVEFNSNCELLTPKVAEKLFEAGVDVMRLSIDGFYRETFDESRGINYDRVYKNAKNFIKRKQELNHHVETEVRMIRFPGTEKEQVKFEEYWGDLGAKVLFTDLYSYPWEEQTESIVKPCLKLLKETFVYVDGTVTMCCWDASERGLVGDASKENVLDIWNGKKLGDYRALLAEGKRDQILLCSRCDAYKDVDFSTLELSD